MGRNRNGAAPTNEPTVKRLVRERDGYCCRECGMNNVAHLATFGRSLQVHRLTPGGRYVLENCTTLCQPCHAKKPRSRYKCSNRVKLPPVIHEALLGLTDARCQTVGELVVSFVMKELHNLGEIHAPFWGNRHSEVYLPRELCDRIEEYRMEQCPQPHQWQVVEEAIRMLFEAKGFSLDPIDNYVI